MKKLRKSSIQTCKLLNSTQIRRPSSCKSLLLTLLPSGWEGSFPPLRPPLWSPLEPLSLPGIFYSIHTDRTQKTKSWSWSSTTFITIFKKTRIIMATTSPLLQEEVKAKWIKSHIYSLIGRISANSMCITFVASFNISIRRIASIMMWAVFRLALGIRSSKFNVVKRVRSVMKMKIV